MTKAAGIKAYLRRHRHARPADLARRFGCTSEYARQLRRACGLPRVSPDGEILTRIHRRTLLDPRAVIQTLSARLSVSETSRLLTILIRRPVMPNLVSYHVRQHGQALTADECAQLISRLRARRDLRHYADDLQ